MHDNRTEKTFMRWIRPVIASLPFAFALVINILVYADWHSERIAGYGFLFATPWGWLLDRDWFFGHPIAHWANTLETLFVILWGPALLYSACLCALMWILERALRNCRALIAGTRVP
jgi:hypothetical protein